MAFFDTTKSKQAIALFASLTFCLLLSEGITRIFYRPTLLDPEMLIAHDREFLPFGLKPNYSGYYVGGKVSIDGEGNRTVNATCTGSKTLLLLGDSVVFGQGLDNNQTMASQLQARLCGHYQVRNLGVPGYTSWNEYAAFQAYPHHVDELILVYVPNDPTFNNDHFDLRNRRLGELSDDRVHRTLRFLYSHVYLSFLAGNGIKALLHYGDKRDSPFGVDESAVQYSMQALEQLRDLCDQKSIRFSVAVYRDVGYYLNPNASGQYEALIRKNLEQRGIRAFVIKSHVEQLRLNEARVAWNDPHPSGRAVGLIVKDLSNTLIGTD